MELLCLLPGLGTPMRQSLCSHFGFLPTLGTSPPDSKGYVAILVSSPHWGPLPQRARLL